MKSLKNKKLRNLGIPSPRSLTKTIKSCTQMTNMSWLIWINKAFRLCQNISSAINPCKKALFTSSYCIYDLKCKTKVITNRIVANLMIRLKVSLKSIPDYWVNPWATSLSLYLAILPCVSRLIFNIHCDPISRWLAYGNTNTLVLVKIIIHCLTPMEMLRSLYIWRWFCFFRRLNNKTELGLWFCDSSF